MSGAAYYVAMPTQKKGRQWAAVVLVIMGEEC